MCFSLRELSVFLKPWSESITGFPCCWCRGWRKRAEAKVRGQSESCRVVYDMTLRVSWPWGDWDTRTPVGAFVRTPGSEGLVCMGRTLHLVQEPTIILPAIQTHSTPIRVRFPIRLLIPEQGSVPGCQPRAECIWAAIDTCLHETPHLSGTKPGASIWEQVTWAGKRRRGQQRLRWLDSINNSMDTNLSKLWEIVKDRHGSLVCCSPWGHKELDRT